MPPSEKLGGARIGCGGRGPGTYGQMCKGLDVELVGACDVDIRKAQNFANRNKGKAKAQDLENLIHKVKKKVLDKTGIKLELEIQIIGKK